MFLKRRGRALLDVASTYWRRARRERPGGIRRGERGRRASEPMGVRRGPWRGAVSEGCRSARGRNAQGVPAMCSMSGRFPERGQYSMVERVI
jgi:hypothetical protein